MDTALSNYQEQVWLLADLWEEVKTRPEQIAHRLGISREELLGALTYDMSLTELRLLAIACDLKISYTISKTTPEEAGEDGF